MPTIQESVSDYYGKKLITSDDLKTNACCSISETPNYIKAILGKVHDEVLSKYYGCGLTIPSALEGLTVLDLGSGSGRDVYIASALVGEQGRVFGIDITDEQLTVANRHIDYHASAFGHTISNVNFIKCNLDELENLELPKGSIDLIISNCVINLVENKSKVLRNAYELLKSGGEMYFSDVYSDRRIPNLLKKDAVLWGECLSGALYWNDFIKESKKAGFIDPRTVEAHPITIENIDLQSKVGDIKFYSITSRLWKIKDLEDDCEDYGQAVSYKGTIEYEENSLNLDDHHEFPKSKIIPVCGNTYKMLYDTRYKAHFDFYGTWDTHFGIFEGCGGTIPFIKESDEELERCC